MARDATELASEQAAAMQERIRDAMLYVGSLRERMDRRGWDPNDRLYQQTMKAYDALHGLHMWLHYASCGMTGGNRTAGGMGYIVATAEACTARIV